MDFAVVLHLLQEPELAGLAVHNNGETRHNKVLFLIVEFRLQAWEDPFEVLNHLAHGPTRHLHLLLPPGQALHAEGNPHFWHGELPVVGGSLFGP